MCPQEKGGFHLLPKRKDSSKERWQRTFVRDWANPRKRKISTAGAAAAAATRRPASTKRKRKVHHHRGREEGVSKEREVGEDRRAEPKKTEKKNQKNKITKKSKKAAL